MLTFCSFVKGQAVAAVAMGLAVAQGCLAGMAESLGAPESPGDPSADPGCAFAAEFLTGAIADSVDALGRCSVSEGSAVDSLFRQICTAALAQVAEVREFIETCLAGNPTCDPTSIGGGLTDLAGDEVGRVLNDARAATDAIVGEAAPAVDSVVDLIDPTTIQESLTWMVQLVDSAPLATQDVEDSPIALHRKPTEVLASTFIKAGVITDELGQLPDDPTIRLALLNVEIVQATLNDAILAVTAAVVSGDAGALESATPGYRWLCLGDAVTCKLAHTVATGADEAGELHSALVSFRAPSQAEDASDSAGLGLQDPVIVEPLLSDADTSLPGLTVEGGGPPCAQKLPEKSGSGHGTRRAKGQGKSSNKYYGWTLGTNYCLPWYLQDGKGRNIEYRGTADVRADITLGGGGTRRLYVGMRNRDGDPFYSNIAFHCDVKGWNKGHCGSDYGPERESLIFAGQTRGREYAAAGLGYGPLSDGEKYDIEFEFRLTDLDEVSTTDPLIVNSDDFTCPRVNDATDCNFGS